MSETSTLIGYSGRQLAAKNWRWCLHRQPLKLTARFRTTRSFGH